MPLRQSIFKFDLGAKATDTVTGFAGTITGRYEFLNGCIRYSLEALQAGEVKDCTFDEDRLEVVAESDREPVRERTGGPRPTPPRTGP